MVEGQFPRWKSHKIVEGFKIQMIRHTEEGRWVLMQEPESNEPAIEVMVSMEYVHKHDPKAGGYYVRYKDGYESWSPAEAFENGYTRI